MLKLVLSLIMLKLNVVVEGWMFTHKRGQKSAEPQSPQSPRLRRSAPHLVKGEWRQADPYTPEYLNGMTSEVKNLKGSKNAVAWDDVDDEDCDARAVKTTGHKFKIAAFLKKHEVGIRRFHKVKKVIGVIALVIGVTAMIVGTGGLGPVVLGIMALILKIVTMGLSLIASSLAIAKGVSEDASKAEMGRIVLGSTLGSVANVIGADHGSLVAEKVCGVCGTIADNGDNLNALVGKMKAAFKEKLASPEVNLEFFDNCVNPVKDTANVVMGVEKLAEFAAKHM